MVKTRKSPDAATPVVAIPTTPADEAEVIEALCRFAWDEPVPRVARIDAGGLAVDFVEPVEPDTLAHLESLVRRPVRRVDASHAAWTPLTIAEEDG